MEVVKRIYSIGGMQINNQEGSGFDANTAVNPVLYRMADITLQLANSGCYDKSKRLIFNETPIIGSDISKLLTLTMSDSKINSKEKGLRQYVYILKKLGIDPSCIENSNIRKMLLQCKKLPDFISDSSIREPLVLTNIERGRIQKTPDFSKGSVKENIDVQNADYHHTSDLENDKVSKKAKKSKTPLRRSPYQLRKKNDVFWIIPK